MEKYGINFPLIAW